MFITNWDSNGPCMDQTLNFCIYGKTICVAIRHSTWLGRTTRMIWKNSFTRLLADLLLCFKIIHGLIALNFDDFFKCSPNSTLRGHPFKLTVPISRCNRSKYFFSSRIVPVWNCLPAEVVMAKSIFSFKTEVRKVDLSRFLILPCIIC